jgi:hypothetical protein
MPGRFEITGKQSKIKPGGRTLVGPVEIEQEPCKSCDLEAIPSPTEMFHPFQPGQHVHSKSTSGKNCRPHASERGLKSGYHLS